VLSFQLIFENKISTKAKTRAVMKRVFQAEENAHLHSRFRLSCKIMRTIIFSLLFFLFLNGAATAQKIGVRGNKTGGILVTRGKMRATINLRADAAGCAYVLPGERKRQLDAIECTALPATFKLIDASVKNNRIYLVVLTEAMGNCNVCGQCGASEAFGLVWLQLDANLRVIKKKAVPLEFCLEDRSIVSP
jgi:hypothetical protein